MTSESNLQSRPGWLLEEVSNAGRENLDPEHVARYDLKEDADAEAEVRLCRDRGFTKDSTVIEFGVGTGQFALAAAPWSARVVAVDVSPVMLTALRAKIDAAQRHNIEVVQGGFLTYEHRGRLADLVYTRYALHHLPDFWKAVALERIRHILRPGGLLRLWDVVYNFDPSQAEERIEAWCATGGTTVDEAWSRDELEEHVRDEHSTFTWLIEPMMQRCGFRIEAAEYSADGVDAKYLLRCV